MKRWIHAANDPVFQQALDDDEYYSTTPRNEVEFDHDVIWSVQFYERSGDITFDKEVYVLARTFEEAREQAIVLAEAWGYPTGLSECVVQYAYLSPNFWNKLTKEECDGVEYGVG